MSANPEIPARHPEEPRTCAASRRMGACSDPSRLAEDGEHLRMTAVLVSAISKKFSEIVQ
jgi:hypothetical protein